MHILFVILAVVAGLASLGCSIVIWIDMFNDEFWKLLLGLFCCFYMVYYSIVEFEHEWKWPIALGSLGGGSIASGLLKLALANWPT